MANEDVKSWPTDVGPGSADRVGVERGVRPNGDTCAAANPHDGGGCRERKFGSA